MGSGLHRIGVDALKTYHHPSLSLQNSLQKWKDAGPMQFALLKITRYESVLGWCCLFWYHLDMLSIMRILHFLIQLGMGI